MTQFQGCSCLSVTRVVFTLIIIALFLAACATANQVEVEPAPVVQVVVKPAPIVEKKPVPAPKATKVAVKTSKKKRIMFDFDSNLVKSSYFEDIKVYAVYLSQNTDLTVTLEGHSDSRGPTQYNKVLGERRAKAVAKLLSDNGVAASRIKVVSYGEQRPIANTKGEAAWDQNRRVEINYVASVH